MHRIEIIGLFTALKSLVKTKQYEEIENVIDAVLEEAQLEKKKNEKSNPKEE